MADRLSVLKYYLYYKYKKRFSDRSALERWQVEKIRKHLEYVGDHSRLYKGMKKLSSYPVIDKKFMMEHFDELNTVGIGREEALNLRSWQSANGISHLSLGGNSRAQFRHIGKTGDLSGIG
ncbi:hypothetical protein [Enterocloster sp.]|uniref:hypothetical protein n=1 Tax=Enterocloster sp. TaxID=2719315 RepID=UPI0039A03324